MQRRMVGPLILSPNILVLNFDSCGLSMRANAAQVECVHCGKAVVLRPDPRAVV